ncbi:MAG: Lrp/AsnC family transcriptional regulator [Saprospiraceae bacterium]
MKELDQIDRTILNLLQENGKLNVKEIAEQLGITKTPIYERIKRLENDGIIDRYVALLNREKISPSIIVFCSITLEMQKFEYFDQFYQQIIQFPEVMECYTIGGGFDFMLKIVVKDLQAYYDFSSQKLATLPNIGGVTSSFVLKEIKNSTVLPV